jgi:hypothetical protein
MKARSHYLLACLASLAGCMPTGKACPGCAGVPVTIKTVTAEGDTLSPVSVRILEPDSAKVNVEIIYAQVFLYGPLGQYRVRLEYADGEVAEIGDILVKANPASDCGGIISQFLKVEKSAVLPKGAVKGGYKVVERSSHPGCG